MAKNIHCANCECSLEFIAEMGESNLHSPGQGFDLCIPCLNEEENLIEDSGHNDHPDRVALYRANVTKNG